MLIVKRLVNFLWGPFSPLVRVTFGCLYAGPVVSHLFVVTQDRWHVSDTTALLYATGLLLAAFGALLCLWMQVLSTTLDTDRGFLFTTSSSQPAQAKRQSPPSTTEIEKFIGNSRHCASIYWIIEALSVLGLPSVNTSNNNNKNKRRGTESTTNHKKARSILQEKARVAAALVMWGLLEISYHATMVLEQTLRLRTVVITAAQLLFCFYNVNASLFERPDGKFGLSTVDFWMWKVGVVGICLAWHLSPLPVSTPKWERSARILGYVSLITVFARFSSFSSISSLEWDDADLLGTAMFLPMSSSSSGNNSKLGAMSSQELSLPFTSSLLISCLMLTFGFESGRAVKMDPTLVTSLTTGKSNQQRNSLTYRDVRRAVWFGTLWTQVGVILFLSLISVLAVTGVNHGSGGHTMLTNVIVKVSSYVHRYNSDVDEINASGILHVATDYDELWRWFWPLVAQLSCLVAFTAMVPGCINTCLKQAKIIIVSVGRVEVIINHTLLGRKFDGGVSYEPYLSTVGTIVDVSKNKRTRKVPSNIADTLLLLTSETHLLSNTAVPTSSTRKNKKTKPILSTLPTSWMCWLIAVGIALLPTLFNNGPYGFAPAESNDGAALPAARSILRAIDNYTSCNWLSVLYAISIFVEFIVPSMGGIAFYFAASNDAILSTSEEDEFIVSPSLASSIRLRKFVACLTSLVVSSVLLLLTNLYL